MLPLAIWTLSKEWQGVPGERLLDVLRGYDGVLLLIVHLELRRYLEDQNFLIHEIEVVRTTACLSC